MPANRCSLCSINYPTSYPNNFSSCPVCDSRLDRFEEAEPYANWKERSDYLKERLRRLGEAASLVPLIRGEIVERDGILRLSSYDVSASDVWTTLVPEEIVQVGERFYEVEGYLDSSREYVVSPFSVELSGRDLARLAGGDGSSPAEVLSVSELTALRGTFKKEEPVSKRPVSDWD